MTSDDYLDLEKCSKDGESTQNAVRFKVRIDNKYVKVDDKTTTGRDLLKKANLSEEHKESVYIKRIRDGLEEIGIDTPIDLTEKGIVCFVTSDNSTQYKYTLDDKEHVWQGNLISGRTLKENAGVDPNSYSIWWENPNGADEKIDDSRFFEFCVGVQLRFFSVPDQTTAGNNW